MKVKSFAVGLAEGYSHALELLDKSVAGLNATEIQSVTDTLYPSDTTWHKVAPPSHSVHIARVVVYR